MTLVINNCLSYIETARNSLNANEIVSIVENFYKESAILEAKDLLYERIGDRPSKVPVRRKTENRIEMEIRDILTGFEFAETNSTTLPQFVAYGHMALPPPTGFELVTAAISSLRDDISGVKNEMAGHNRLKEEFQLMRTEMEKFKSEIALQVQKPSFAGVVNRGQPGVPHPSGAIGKTPAHFNRHAMRQPAAPPATLGHTGALRPPSMPERRDSTSRDARGDDSWRPARTRRKPIMGTKTDETNGLRIAPRYGELYVGGCEKNETEERITEYCKANCKVTPLEVEKLKTRSTDYVAFRLKFKLADRNICLNGEFWSAGTIVRKFFRPRSEINQNQNNG